MCVLFLEHFDMHRGTFSNVKRWAICILDEIQQISKCRCKVERREGSFPRKVELYLLGLKLVCTNESSVGVLMCFILTV